MKKILEYGLGLYCWLNATVCNAVEKFEVLPDLPDPLAAYAQPAQAASVTNRSDTSSLLAGQSIGHEPNLISVFFSLLIVILLIYITGILYTKLNKAGFHAMKRQQGDLAKSQVAVISTTTLGNNRSLHVVELDGKRMLIGASSGAIQLLKDLGSISDEDKEQEYSSIEIPTIKIPKIEIPKIEIPTIGFSKLMTKIHKDIDKQYVQTDNVCKTEITDVSDEEEIQAKHENPEGIIDSLFTQQTESLDNHETETHEESATVQHRVDPDEFTLYKKYLS